MPSSLRTTRTQTAPTTRRKGTRSFPGLHAVDDICPGILAGVCIRYMRVRMPVAHKGEWRPKQRRRRRAKQQKPPAGDEFRKNNIDVFYLFYYIYIYYPTTFLLSYYFLKFIPNSQKVRATTSENDNSQKRKVPSSKGESSRPSAVLRTHTHKKPCPKARKQTHRKSGKVRARVPPQFAAPSASSQP